MKDLSFMLRLFSSGYRLRRYRKESAKGKRADAPFSLCGKPGDPASRIPSEKPHARFLLGALPAAVQKGVE